MNRFQPTRSASLVIALLGFVANFTIAIQIIGFWRAIKWAPDAMRPGHDEDDSYTWRGLDAVKLVWSLLSVYFASSATVCAAGLYGIVRNKSGFVRFYRDYSIADFAFCSFFMVVGTYHAFASSVRTTLCEELSRQPELLHDLVDFGLSLENCEQWFERTVFAGIALFFVILVIRLHFLLAVSAFYSQLVRLTSRPILPRTRSHSSSHSRRKSDSMRRIYVLPRSHATSNQPKDNETAAMPSEEVYVYAPIPLSSLAPDARATATEAWISGGEAALPSPRQHQHRRSATGRIVLPITPGEALLPRYEELSDKA